MTYEILIKDEKGLPVFHDKLQEENIRVTSDGIITINTGMVINANN